MELSHIPITSQMQRLLEIASEKRRVAEGLSAESVSTALDATAAGPGELGDERRELARVIEERAAKIRAEVNEILDAIAAETGLDRYDVASLMD